MTLVVLAPKPTASLISRFTSPNALEEHQISFVQIPLLNQPLLKILVLVLHVFQNSNWLLWQAFLSMKHSSIIKENIGARVGTNILT